MQLSPFPSTFVCLTSPYFPQSKTTSRSGSTHDNKESLVPAEKLMKGVPDSLPYRMFGLWRWHVSTVVFMFLHSLSSITERIPRKLIVLSTYLQPLYTSWSKVCCVILKAFLTKVRNCVEWKPSQPSVLMTAEGCGWPIKFLWQWRCTFCVQVSLKVAGIFLESAVKQPYHFTIPYTRYLAKTQAWALRVDLKKGVSMWTAVSDSGYSPVAGSFKHLDENFWTSWAKWACQELSSMSHKYISSSSSSSASGIWTPGLWSFFISRELLIGLEKWFPEYYIHV